MRRHGIVVPCLRSPSPRSRRRPRWLKIWSTRVRDILTSRGCHFKGSPTVLLCERTEQQQPTSTSLPPPPVPEFRPVILHRIIQHSLITLATYVTAEAPHIGECRQSTYCNLSNGMVPPNETGITSQFFSVCIMIRLLIFLVP